MKTDHLPSMANPGGPAQGPGSPRLQALQPSYQERFSFFFLPFVTPSLLTTLSAFSPLLSPASASIRRRYPSSTRNTSSCSTPDVEAVEPGGHETVEVTSEVALQESSSSIPKAQEVTAHPAFSGEWPRSHGALLFLGIADSIKRGDVPGPSRPPTL